MNSRLNQVVNMGIGAGIMYFLDPAIGKRRRGQLRDQAKGQIDLAVQAATRQVDQAIDAAARQVDTAREAVVLAQRQARMRALDMVPAAKVALIKKLAEDQQVLDRAQKALGKNGLMLRGRRSVLTPAALALALLGAAALGAGLMFVLEPRMGRRRQGLMEDQFTHARHEAAAVMTGTSADVANRAKGAAAEARLRTSDATVSDQVLEERVRSHLGGITSHPGSISVTAHQGRVTLSGPILASEVDGLLARVRTVPGVQDVENHLEVHKEPGDVPGLQG